MITHVHIQNFRSFLDAEVDLEPFSLVVGANGSGKTNLLRFFEVVSQPTEVRGIANDADERFIIRKLNWVPHINFQEGKCRFEFLMDTGESDEAVCEKARVEGKARFTGPVTHRINSAIVINLDSRLITSAEQVYPEPKVGATGEGTTQVLDVLKNGDREDLFDRIEASFKRYVPEVEKLSLRTVKEGHKQIQVKEKGLKEPTPGPELSEGTRLILALLTIIHQEKPPPIILLEDIDRGMHPRLFEYIAPLMRDMAVQNGINILATTHNPYLVDAFQDNKKAVIIVEKKDGVSTLTTLDKRLEGLNYEEINPEDMPLGALWYSGIVGGTPVKISHKAEV